MHFSKGYHIGIPYFFVLCRRLLTNVIFNKAVCFNCKYLYLTINRSVDLLFNLNLIYEETFTRRHIIVRYFCEPF